MAYGFIGFKIINLREICFVKTSEYSDHPDIQRDKKCARSIGAWLNERANLKDGSLYPFKIWPFRPYSQIMDEKLRRSVVHAANTTRN